MLYRAPPLPFPFDYSIFFARDMPVTFITLGFSVSKVFITNSAVATVLVVSVYDKK